MSSRALVSAFPVIAAFIGVVLCPQPSDADPFTFTKIIDSAGAIRPYGWPNPAINNAGRVVFLGNNAGDPSIGPFGLFAGDGGPITTIMTVPDGWSPGHPYASLQDFLNQDPSIDDYGTAFFMDAGWVGWEILAGNGGPVTTLLDDTGPFESFGRYGPQVNQHGTLVFLAQRDSGEMGVYLLDQGNLTTVADDTATFTAFAWAPNINNLGTVIFDAQTDTGEIGIFAAENGTITRVVDNTGLFAYFGHGDAAYPLRGDHDINDEGTIVFKATLDDGSKGVFTILDGELSTIVDDTGPIVEFTNDPFINSQGMVVYEAELADGTMGLFTGPDFSADSVVKTGDALDGSIVNSVWSWGHGLNDRGQVAFYAQLDDGRRGIYVASPVVVPEPSAFVLLGTGMVTLLLMAYGTIVRRRRKRP